MYVHHLWKNFSDARNQKITLAIWTTFPFDFAFILKIFRRTLFYGVMHGYRK